MGISASGVLVSIVLHNFLYALGVLTKNIILLHYIFEFLHAAFFIIGLVICPIVFVISLVNSLRLPIHTRD